MAQQCAGAVWLFRAQFSVGSVPGTAEMVFNWLITNAVPPIKDLWEDLV